MKLISCTTIEVRLGLASHAPLSQWSIYFQASLGRRRRTLIGKISAKVLLRVRVRTQCHLGPEPPVPERARQQFSRPPQHSAARRLGAYYREVLRSIKCLSGQVPFDHGVPVDLAILA